MKRPTNLQACLPRCSEAEQKWTMWPDVAGMILLVLHTVRSQESKTAPPKLDQIVASPGANIQISCSLPSGFFWWSVAWYKEQPGGGLRRIYVSYRKWEPEGKFSGRVPNLTISNVQRNDSGVYYCASTFPLNFTIFSGARVIITDTPRPSCSILAPLALEGTQPNHSVPLLCLMFDANPAWDNFSWDVSEESSRDQRGVGVIDADGAFSVWHFKMIPLTEGTGEEAHPCSLQEYRSARPVMSTDKGNCIFSLYLGIPSILLLLVPTLILLFRKHQARENSQRVENQVPKRETPQTDYAEVRFESSNVPCVD